MRKLIFGMTIAFVGLTTAAFGQGIYQGGSHEPGLVPTRIHNSHGPWGVRPPQKRYHHPQAAYPRYYPPKRHGHAHPHPQPMPRHVHPGPRHHGGSMHTQSSGKRIVRSSTVSVQRRIVGAGVVGGGATRAPMPAAVAVVPVAAGSAGTVRQRVEHPFANVPPARQYRCAVGPNGQMVAANPGTGWCYDE